MSKIAQIALPIPADRLFDYEIPDNIVRENYVGCRAIVPLGKRLITGYIVALKDNAADKAKYRIRKISEIPDTVPVLSESILQLTKWIASYYIVSWGVVLKAALPQGMSPNSVIRFNVNPDIDSAFLDKQQKIAPKRTVLLKFLMSNKQNTTINHIENVLGIKSVSILLEALANMGLITFERIIEKKSLTKKQNAVLINSEFFENPEKLKNLLNDLDKKAPKQAVIISTVYAEQLHSGKPCLSTKIIEKTRSSRASLKSLVEKGILSENEVVIHRDYDNNNELDLSSRNEALLTLTDEQHIALDAINNAADCGLYKSFLLYGVTGSGKTLVYMHTIKNVIDKGKTALLLVPEISLTPQLIDRFKRVFPDMTSVLHSRMSEGERYDAWMKIKNGDSKIVIGARSAIFAPLNNLGLIIVDEEHESSYKQESPAPRYNARDCALIRGNFEKAAVVLGSATPSLESMYNAQNNKHTLLTIKNRADNAVLPHISVIDMIDAHKNGKVSGSFSLQLVEKTAAAVKAGEAVIILQNRRGFSVHLECPECGNVPGCKNCDITMTYHKSAEQLRCHYCGYTLNAPKICTECGNAEMLKIGWGTQKIEKELGELLADFGVDAKIERMDLDTTHRKGTHRALLHRFASGQTDILVGTQMVAKGLDFERVTLVGVVDADLQMFLPDFRANERTFQLLTQVAGRSGRSGRKPGEVYIQTKHSDSHTIKTVIESSYENFWNDELSNRRNAIYPPFSRFILIEFQSENENDAALHAENFRSLLPSKDDALLVLGPTVPSIARLKGKFRRIIVIKNIKANDNSGRKLQAYLRYAVENYLQNTATQKVKLIIDVDSYSAI